MASTCFPAPLQPGENFHVISDAAENHHYFALHLVKTLSALMGDKVCGNADDTVSLPADSFRVTLWLLEELLDFEPRPRQYSPPERADLAEKP
jgi:hypothetical protein